MFTCLTKLLDFGQEEYFQKKKKRKRILSNQINNLNRPVMPKEIKEVVKTLPVTNKQTNKFSARGFLI